MIAYVTGKLTGKKPAEALIEAGGLGYSILIATSTYERLPALSEQVSLQTYLYVREDAMKLFGFSTGSERALFRLLISVAGVGPKLALAVLSSMTPAELRNCILGDSTQPLTRVPGIGRKTAERLIIELRDRVSEIAGDDLPHGDRYQARADAMAGLETLGLSRAAAERRLRVVQRKNPEVTAANELIRLALRD